MTKFYFTSTIYHDAYDENNEHIERWFSSKHTLEQMLSYYDMEKNEPRGYNLISCDWVERHSFNRSTNCESWEYDVYDSNFNRLAHFNLVAFYNWEE